MIGLIKRVWRWRLSNWGQRLQIFAALILIASSAGMMGCLGGLLWATESTLPRWLMGSTESPLVVPTDTEIQTYDQIVTFLKEDETEDREYGEGFNCVEFSLLVARNAEWEGISCDVFRISFVGTDVGHAIVGFPTTDREWIFVEPQDDLVINPVPGTYYEGKKIQSVEQLVMNWSEIEWTN
jgi:hypothetical protein